MTAMKTPFPAEALRVVPANEASWEDLLAVFGTTDYPGRCHCQSLKVTGWIWRDSTQEQRTAMLRTQTGCGDPDAATTSGLVAYLDDEPVGWVAVEPRTAYPKLRSKRTPWSGREEDKQDDSVWAVTCFVVRRGYRGRGLTYLLAGASIDYARERGARALEAYPMITEPGKEITWGELHVGARQVFEDAGFREVSHPTLRRVVMRIDLTDVDQDVATPSPGRRGRAAATSPPRGSPTRRSRTRTAR
jgi:GNAT superfamily N-acetyltransferase